MIQKIKELVETHSYVELEKCIEQQISSGRNTCYTGSSDEETMNVLSKASFVKQLVEEGKVESVTEGLRKLAGTMRSLQQNVKKNDD